MDLYRFEWLAKRNEAAIDARRPIIDPHHHLWRNQGGTYVATELLADTGGSHNVTHTVFVECRSKWDRDVPAHMAPVGETRFVAGEAAEMAERGGALIGAIVSHADLTTGDGVAEVLAAHQSAGAGLFRGIRQSTALDPGGDAHSAHTGTAENIMVSDAFIAGARELARMGFSFDAWLYHPQIDQLLALAAAVPELRIVLDHLGGPLGIGSYAAHRDEVGQAWRAAMTAAAGHENIVLKVGGIGMDDVYGTGWTEAERPPSSEEVAAYWSNDVRWCIDTFGPGRCMFESNFPVDRQSIPYSVLWNAFQIMADGYAVHEQDLLFSGTAATTYRIDLL